MTVVALGAWLLLVFLGRVWIEKLERGGHVLNFDTAAPLIGRIEWHPSFRIAFPIAVAVLGVLVVPAVTRLPWRVLLVGAAAWSALWAVTVVAVDLDGWEGLTRPLRSPDQYMQDVPEVGSIGEFVRTFTERAPDYATHVSSHPPGMVVVHLLMDRVGLSGLGWAAAAYIGMGALAVPAVLLGVREVSGERSARRAAPFVAVAPTAIWIATTADAFFTGVGAWAVTCVVLATGARRRRADALALAGGLLFGAVAFLSYGLPLLAVVPGVVALVRRRLRPLVVAALGAMVVFAAFWAGGFWWLDGVGVAGDTFHGGVGGRRPYGVFLVVNWSIFAAALGPAIAVALARLRDGRMWLVVGATLAALVVATLSGMSRSEVERVWLPFAPWVLVACAALAGRSLSTRAWLAVQVGYTLLVTTLLVGPW